jgi:hypothetical protein
MDDSRNPYVLLGVPFGVSGDAAAGAFAKRSRGLRRAPDGVERLTELTWALNQVQAALKDPSAAVHIYRVPADPGALEPEGHGLFAPAPQPMGRQSGDSAKAREELLSYARWEALSALVDEIATSQQLPIR